jgi:D-3-phosphoglycerate dehydrogenase
MCVGCFCIGTDQTDLLHAASMGVPVFNVLFFCQIRYLFHHPQHIDIFNVFQIIQSPYANTRSVAELVIGEMIALARQFVDRSNECHKGQWKKDSKGCYEIRGKTLGIIGYGRVGSQLSVLAESLGAKVIFYGVFSLLSRRSVPFAFESQL